MANNAGVTAIDAKRELEVELDELSAESDIAAGAPRVGGLSRYLSSGIACEEQRCEPDGPYWRLVVRLIQKLGIWWPRDGYAALPVMTPWCIRDRSARYDQGPEAWGTPRADGYLRDDNSIIKKLPLPLVVEGPEGSRIARRKIQRGFTACHIWGTLADASLGGADPWVYSFMPNLVWLPSPLSALTDHNVRVQRLLQRASYRMFFGKEGSTTDSYARRAWAQLSPEGAENEQDQVLDCGEVATFIVDHQFIARRLKIIDQIALGVEDILGGKRLSGKIICTRYTSGLPTLERDALEVFQKELADYSAAVRAGVSVR